MTSPLLFHNVAFNTSPIRIFHQVRPSVNSESGFRRYVLSSLIHVGNSTKLNLNELNFVQCSVESQWWLTKDNGPIMMPDHPCSSLWFLTCIVEDNLYKISRARYPTYTTLPLTFSVNSFKFLVIRNSPRSNAPSYMTKYSFGFRHHSQYLRVMKMNWSCACFDSLNLFGQYPISLSIFLFHSLQDWANSRFSLFSIMLSLNQYHACNGPGNVLVFINSMMMDQSFCELFML